MDFDFLKSRTYRWIQKMTDMKFDFRYSKTYTWLLRIQTVFRAVDLEYRLGMRRFHDLIKYQPFFPGRDTWRAITKHTVSFSKKNYTIGHESLRGLLCYLLVYNIPCSDLDQLIQQCVDNDYICELLLLTQVRIPLYQNTGDLICILKPPFLDRAIKHEFTTMFEVCSEIFGIPQLQRPDDVIEYIFNHWSYKFCNSLKLINSIVPNIANIRTVKAMRFAASSQEAFRFALFHCDPIALNEGVLLSLAEHGDLLSIKLCLEKSQLQMSQNVWNEAFFNNHPEVMNAFPQFKITSDSIIQACREGCLVSIKALGENVILPRKCLINAIASGNTELIRYVFQKIPNAKITRKMLESSIDVGSDNKSGDQVASSAFLTCFVLADELSLLDSKMKCKIIDCGKTNLFEILHSYDEKDKIGLNMFNDQTLIRAAANCNLEILDMMQDKKWSQMALENAESQLHQWSMNSLNQDTNTRMTKRQKAYDLVCNMQKYVQ